MTASRFSSNMCSAHSYLSRPCRYGSEAPLRSQSEAALPEQWLLPCAPKIM
jgi:hypothetical protein